MLSLPRYPGFCDTLDASRPPFCRPAVPSRGSIAWCERPPLWRALLFSGAVTGTTDDLKIDNLGVVCYPFQAMLDAQELAVGLLRCGGLMVAQQNLQQSWRLAGKHIGARALTRCGL